jgi:hypothetical protein
MHKYVVNVLSRCCVCFIIVFKCFYVFFKCFRRGADLELGSIDVTSIALMIICVIVSYVHSNFPLSLEKSLLSSDNNSNTVDPPLFQTLVLSVSSVFFCML